MTIPLVKPIRPEFSSGPCAKRPGWSLKNLNAATLGRSHRHKVAKNKLEQAIKLTKAVLESTSPPCTSGGLDLKNLKG